jgi:hypothetical protein
MSDGSGSLQTPPSPNLEDQVSVFMSSSDRVAQLYPKAPCYLFVAFYVSQGNGVSANYMYIRTWVQVSSAGDKKKI